MRNRVKMNYLLRNMDNMKYRMKAKFEMRNRVKRRYQGGFDNQPYPQKSVVRIVVRRPVSVPRSPQFEGTVVTD